jgi:hypothetical protein
MSENENKSAEPVKEVVTDTPKPVETKVETPKPVEAKPTPTAITLPEEPGEGPGLIGSTTVKAAKKADQITKATTAKDDLVALFSSKNYYWDENGGALKKGYNIVEKATADKWLTLEGVRTATPEEVATAFEAGNR